MLYREAKRILNHHREDLARLGVRALSVFGSVAKNKARSKSDVDILIDFDAKKGLFVFMRLKNYLEKLLTCKVDLITKNALHPALKKRILSETKHIF